MFTDCKMIQWIMSWLLEGDTILMKQLQGDRMIHWINQLQHDLVDNAHMYWLLDVSFDNVLVKWLVITIVIKIAKKEEVHILTIPSIEEYKEMIPITCSC